MPLIKAELGGQSFKNLPQQLDSRHTDHLVLQSQVIKVILIITIKGWRTFIQNDVSKGNSFMVRHHQVQTPLAFYTPS